MKINKNSLSGGGTRQNSIIKKRILSAKTNRTSRFFFVYSVLRDTKRAAYNKVYDVLLNIHYVLDSPELTKEELEQEKEQIINEIKTVQQFMEEYLDIELIIEQPKKGKDTGLIMESYDVDSIQTMFNYLSC